MLAGQLLGAGLWLGGRPSERQARPWRWSKGLQGLTIADQMLGEQQCGVLKSGRGEKKQTAEQRRQIAQTDFPDCSLQRERVRASIPRTSARYVLLAQKIREK